MILDAVVVSSKAPQFAMAASSLQAPLSLEILPADEGRSMLRRQGSLTPGSSSPKVDWRASGGATATATAARGRSSTIRRAHSMGSALSEFLGSTAARKSLDENSAMRRSGSRGCLDSLEASSNARASMDGMGDDGWSERFEEDREWNFATLDNTLRPGGMLHRDTFPSPRFLSQEWQSFGEGGNNNNKDSLNRLPRTQLRRAGSTGHKMAAASPMKSIVLEQAQESFDSLKDRLESSLRMQPECSYARVAASSCTPAMAPNEVVADATRGAGLPGLAKGVSGLKLSTLPQSLKRRKHKTLSESSKSSSRGPCAMSNAFSALVFIIKSMHGHALELHALEFQDSDNNRHHVNMKLLTPMQRDMDLSFAWLFQRVFATTPEYMLSIMILLAEFTAHSLGADMAFAAAASAMANPNPSPPPVAKEDVSVGLRKELNRRSKQGSTSHAASEPRPEVLTRIASSDPKLSAADERVMNALMAEAMKEMESNAGWQPLPVVATKLVAPVQVTISPDNYACFDRTDLEYQHALSSQPANVMLLSNYAQFLYVVRHDNNRAEEYFHRAIRANPSDQEVLGRFATFLWLARGDKETAERAFRAAAALDPTNPHHAGEYSHFLWHSDDSRHPKFSATCFVGNS